MICEECKKEGKTSRINAPSGGLRTCMGTQQYYDEKGRYHSHDPNRTCMVYRCSNGHEWSKSELDECPVEDCEFNKNGGRYVRPSSAAEGSRKE